MGRNLNNLWYYNYGQLVGISHGTKTPCQDYAYSCTKHGVSIAVLSDGCGSSPLSQYGSRTTCEALVDLFTNNMDTICKLNPFELRKLIIESIIKNILSTIHNNYSIFEQYIKNDNRAEDKIKNSSLETYLLSLTYATALFAACKDDVAIIGQIGDGTIGVIKNDKLMISLEEQKEGEVNGTLYPANIYTHAIKDPNWYMSKDFRIAKGSTVNLTGFVLTSDGVDALFDKRIKGQNKYANGCVNLINTIKKYKNFDKSQKYLHNLLTRAVQKSCSFDDCSISVIVNKAAIVDGKVVKDYLNMTNDTIENINIQRRNMYLRKIKFKKNRFRSSAYVNSSRIKNKKVIVWI